MKNIGLQLYTLKDFTEKDFLGTLKNVAEIGYHGVEFAGFFGVPAKELKGVLDHLGLKAAGSHVGIDPLQNQLDELMAYSSEIGNNLLICPYLAPDFCSSADAYKRTAERLNIIGEKCRMNGFSLGYHNHGFEFDLHDGETGLDILLSNTAPENLFLELDTFWVEYSGLKSIDIMTKHKNRCKLLHMKDGTSFAEDVNTELGKGFMEFGPIATLGKEIGVEWYTVEQESFIQDPMLSVKEDFEFLKALL